MLRFGMVVGLLVSLVVGSVQAQDEQALLDEVVSEFVGAEGAALAVQVTTPDGSWAAAAGFSDGERAARVDDRFRIASMSKTYVATLALLLVEEGMFDLDDPAREWLPDEVVANIANADAVTLRQLLSMRSGIDDYLGTDAFWDAVLDDPAREWTLDEALSYAYELPALDEPDAIFDYSNTNYLLLQMVLEEAAGMSLHELSREWLFDPLGLHDTYTQISESLPGGFVQAFGDLDGDGALEDVTTVNDGAGLGDGALVSTVGDVTAFYAALLQEESLLDAALMDELLDFQDTGEGDGYSLGLSEWDTEFGTAWGHSGAVTGFVTIGMYLPDEEAIIVVLSASESVDPAEVAEAAAQAMLN